MPTRLAPAALLLLLLSPAMLLAATLGGRRGAMVFALGALVFPALLVALALGRPERRARGAGIAALLAIVLLVPGVVLLVLPATAAGTVSTAVLLLGLGLAPLLLVALVYALTFDRLGVEPGTLARLREIARRR